MNIHRRAFLGILAAPAIVKATNLMPVRGLIMAVQEPLLAEATTVPSYGWIDLRVIGWDAWGNKVSEIIQVPYEPDHLTLLKRGDLPWRIGTIREHT